MDRVSRQHDTAMTVSVLFMMCLVEEWVELLSLCLCLCVYGSEFIDCSWRKYEREYCY